MTAAVTKGFLVTIEDEPGTTVWLAVRLGPTSFAVIDAFPDEDARQAHLVAGRARLMAGADLFAAPPTVVPTDVLAAKVPDPSGQTLSR